MKPFGKVFSVQTSVILGSIIIGLAILISGGVIKPQILKTGTNQAANLPANNTPPVAQPTAAPGAKVNVEAGHLPAKGNPAAKVSIIEFADFQCPFCERFFSQVGQNIIKDYVDTGKAKFSFRHYAFLGQESTWAAEASECANEQGKFWEYHDYLYNHQGQENSGAFAKDKLEGFAQTLGLNTEQFKNCLETDKYADKVKADLADGQKAGVNGTPATFINGQLISGAAPYANFKIAIDGELAK
ncbi:DsbA family protein [Candidatus Daviesbacteria bacterium]|nr:DsbA family protein [Candidatus Daviesbacteria bacterium]